MLLASRTIACEKYYTARRLRNWLAFVETWVRGKWVCGLSQADYVVERVRPAASILLCIVKCSHCACSYYLMTAALIVQKFGNAL